jgi:transcriptional regulator
MYIRAVHAEADLRVLRRLIHDNPLGLLTTGIHSPNYSFLQTSHIPFVLDVQDESSETELGCLRGHLARQNPHSKAIIESLTKNPELNNVLEHEVLVLFNTPAHHYVTPKFYTKTKPDTGKVVPTWNYAAAQVYGKARIYYDSKDSETSDFLGKQISDLTHHNETATMGYTGGDQPTEWKVSDAPQPFIDLMKKNIVGIEIQVTRLEGKFKMSQELTNEDREGVIEGFKKLGSDVGEEISAIVKERHEQKFKECGI